MNATCPLLFALQGSQAYGHAVARRLGVTVSMHEERDYEDGEHKCWPTVSANGRQVVVFHSLYGDEHRSTHDKLCRLLFFCAALKDAGACQVTVVAPYLCYGRKDRKVEFQDSTITRHVARLMECCGVDRIVTLDVHNPSAFDNAYRIPAWNLQCTQVFAHRFATLLGEQPVAVVSPDLGGAKRAEHFREALAGLLAQPVSGALMEKHRDPTGLRGKHLVGDVAGRTVIVFDDLISTGQTLLRAGQACLQAGASRVLAAATHGLFTTGGQPFEAGVFERVLVADSVPPLRLPAHCQRQLEILDTTALVAELLLENGRDPARWIGAGQGA
ncbi:ribose-phosphate diphosphokinase [Pseudomonas putida]|uniref:ribose-phosphate diphosphokinase n=1 Tax=Pseudomonas putida TaxID=303 RepID=UPI001C24F118|nr:ribose-phosphate diphosphokinase [Pseudomonas putida]